MIVKSLKCTGAVEGRLSMPGGPERRHRSGALAAAAVAAAALSCAPAWATGLPDFENLVREQGQAVVSVSVDKSLQPAASEGPGLQNMPDEFRRFFERSQPSPEQGNGRQHSTGIGSGFVISDDGYIVTNTHVIDGATTVKVEMQNRREFDATVVGQDEATDVALLKIDADSLPVARFGDSDEVQVGQWVLAIGSPFGLDQTATQGIVSAVARSLPSGTYAPFIQTDVAVNPGNSGGPLFNTDGEVVGVNSQIYSRSGGYQGLSFAIPSNVVMRVVDQLKATGHASRGWLGVAIQNVDQALADAFGLDGPEGALVSSVTSDSPAERAGIRQGDVILRFDGEPVERSSDLPLLVGMVAGGNEVPVTVLRDGDEQTLTVVVGEFHADRLAAGDTGTAPRGDRQMGLAVSNLDASQLAETELEHGVRISQLVPDGPAARAGLRRNDIIVSMNGEAVQSRKVFSRLAARLEPGKSVPLLVQRDGQSLYIAVRIPATHE